MYSPSVCVCIPTYNAEKTIARTLDSLLNQTYSNYKIIVVENNCEDATLRIVNEYVKKSDKVSCVHYDVTVPGPENFDRCIELADSDFTCIFHSDDVYANTILEEEVRLFQDHPELGAVFTYANIIDENDIKYSILRPRKEIQKKEIYSYEELMPLIMRYGMCFVTPSAMVRTGIYKNEIKKHLRKPEYGPAFDVDVWLRVLRSHKIGYVRKELINYRMSQNSFSYRERLKYKDTIDDGMIAVLRDYLDESNCKQYYANFNNLVAQRRLDNVFKAYVCGDTVYALNLLSDISSKGLSIKNYSRYLRYSIMCRINFPESIRNRMKNSL